MIERVFPWLLVAAFAILGLLAPVALLATVRP